MLNIKQAAVVLMSMSIGVATAQEIRIIHAEYGHDRRYADVTEMVRRATMRGRLDLVVSNQTFGFDPAPAEVKTLRVEYTLDGRPMREEVPENTRLLLPRGGMPMGDRDRDRDRDMRGPDLRIISAFYGSRNQMVDVGRAVVAYINNGELRMRVNNDTMGIDPARGAEKVLRVEYSFNGQRDSVQVNEGQDLMLPRPGIGSVGVMQQGPPPRYDNRIVVLAAGYGARDRFVDVARILQGRQNPDGSLVMNVTNDTMGGDPFPGPDKVLKVDYQFQGRVMHKDVREGDRLTLP